MTRTLPHKVLLLGSGALKIGEAGEFDYSGSQCLKALEEEGIYTIVVNPNIATLQTDPPRLGRVYFQPLVPEFVAPILTDERPDGILVSFGGQTALNLGVQLAEKGALRAAGTRVLGTEIRSDDGEGSGPDPAEQGRLLPRSGTGGGEGAGVPRDGPRRLYARR
jgi:carbamoyl-phosphate synthase large subunit